MVKKRVIFDIDGTLIPMMDFNKPFDDCLNDMNIRHDKTTLELFDKAAKTYERNFENYNFNDYYNYIKKTINIDINEEVIKRYFEYASKVVPSHVDKYVLDTLDYLKSKYDLVILTNYFVSVQLERIKLLGLDKYFSAIYGGEVYTKPNEEAFLISCGNYDPKECFYAGDNFESDIIGAYNAGIDSVLIDYNNEKENIKVLKRML